MRDDGDFSAYAVARWPSLVRALVLLGSSPDEAHDLARTVLARLRSDWRHRDELGDLDEHTAATLLEYRAGLREPDTRASLVLQALFDVSGPAPEDDLEVVRLDAELVHVEPLDLDQVVRLDQQRRRASRRRTTRVVTSVVAVVAVVAGGWTWWATRPEPPPGLPDAHVELVDNPVAVGWYTDHTLQLDRVALTIDDVRSFEQVRQGAVYADSTGEVVLVALDGERTRLGTQAPDGVFAASDLDGLVAWVDVSDGPELRVFDLAEREVVATHPVSERTTVVAIADGRVFFGDPEGATELDVERDSVSGAGMAGLLDATPSATVRQSSFVAEVYAAKLGGRGLATYLVGLEQGEPDDGPRLSSSGSLQLVTCPLLEPDQFTTCTVHRTFPRDTAWALAQ